MHRIYMTTVNLDTQKLISELVKQQKELHKVLRAQAANKKMLESRAGSMKEEEIALAIRKSKKLKEQVDILKENIGNAYTQNNRAIKDSAKGQQQKREAEAEQGM
eukprot:TRINITY_DN14067_c0_g1_i1.p1 TRINITY_DN14067_c0_g1~~TRINITY_DN14067_c0_g1_i1.p1  ORF type:complete len:105 (-),score=32.99 TRINITY_DN14067_c0_g1_i1:162-476(-)